MEEGISKYFCNYRGILYITPVLHGLCHPSLARAENRKGLRDIIPVFRNLAVMVRVAYPVQDGLTTQRGTGAPQQIAKVIGLTAFARLLRSFYLLQHSLDRGKVARSQARSGKSPLRADAVRRRGDQIEPRRAWRGWLYVSHPRAARFMPRSRRTAGE